MFGFLGMFDMFNVRFLIGQTHVRKVHVWLFGVYSNTTYVVVPYPTYLRSSLVVFKRISDVKICEIDYISAMHLV